MVEEGETLHSSRRDASALVNESADVEMLGSRPATPTAEHQQNGTDQPQLSTPFQAAAAATSELRAGTPSGLPRAVNGGTSTPKPSPRGPRGINRPEPIFVSSLTFAPITPGAATDPSALPPKEGGMKRMDRKGVIKSDPASDPADSTPWVSGGHFSVGAENLGPPASLNHPLRKALTMASRSSEPLPFNTRPYQESLVSDDAAIPSIPTVHSTPRVPPPRIRERLFGLEETKTFYPTPEEFREPLKYIEWAGRPDGGNGIEYGIVKIVPPEGWVPDFVLDQEKFRFRTRVQRLNSLSAEARASHNYLEQLQKFHAQQGRPRVSVPIIDGRPVNLYELKLIVGSHGGYDGVCKTRKWSEITRNIGYDDKVASPISAQVKAAYIKIILPFENFLLRAKQQVKRDAVRAAEGKLLDADGSPSEGSPAPGTSTFSSELLAAGLTPEEVAQAEADALSGGKRRSSRKRLDLVKATTPAGSGRRRRGSPDLDEDDVIMLPGAEEQMCEICMRGDDGIAMLLCDECNRGYHMYCLDPPLSSIPKSQWFCPPCLVQTGNDYGFDDGETHSLASFFKRSHEFRTAWFANRPERIYKPSAEHTEATASIDQDGINSMKQSSEASNGVVRRLPNTDLFVSEDDVEREFWRLVHSPNETVEVEYGADVHSTTHGSALPSTETHPLNPYSTDPWNLQNLPILPGSLLRYIKSDISGMTVPWIYVGMMFSTFCWHNEDHYTSSVNYQHWGDTKTWYGIPGKDAEKFERAMRAAAPDLFETSPDLLFQLVTMMSPETLREHGVRVFACDQRANEFVVTYPKSYHAGFNHGFNLNEAVNFALPDWINDGLECVQRYQQFSKVPVFSHDELLVTIGQHNHAVKTAIWLQHAMREMIERELKARYAIRKTVPNITEIIESQDRPAEREYQCSDCNAFCYLSQVVSNKSDAVACLDHWLHVHQDELPSKLILRLRFADGELDRMHSKIAERAKGPSLWKKRLKQLMKDNDRPSLRALRDLLVEGDRMELKLAPLEHLRSFVETSQDWADKAALFLTQRPDSGPMGPHDLLVPTQNRTVPLESKGGATTAEFRLDRDGLEFMISQSGSLCFDTPEIEGLKTLLEKVDRVEKLAKEISPALDSGTASKESIDEVLSLSSGLNVYIAAVAYVRRSVNRTKWYQSTADLDDKSRLSFKEAEVLVCDAEDCGVPKGDLRFISIQRRHKLGQAWMETANRVYLGDSEITCDQLQELVQVQPEAAIDHDLLRDIKQLLANAKDTIRSLETLHVELRPTFEPSKPPVPTSVLDPHLAEPVSPQVVPRPSLLKKTKQLLTSAKAERLSVPHQAEFAAATALHDEWVSKLDGLIASSQFPGKQTKKTTTDLSQPNSSVQAWCTVIEATLRSDDVFPPKYDEPPRHCICRSSEPAEESDRHSSTFGAKCTQCDVFYHAQCLRVRPEDLPCMRETWQEKWTCVVCNPASLSQTARNRRTMLVTKLAELVDPKYHPHHFLFPPVGMTDVRAAIHKILLFSNEVLTFYHSPREAGDLQIFGRHIIRKLIVTPVDIPLGSEDAGDVFTWLANSLAALQKPLAIVSAPATEAAPKRSMPGRDVSMDSSAPALHIDLSPPMMVDAVQAGSDSVGGKPHSAPHVVVPNAKPGVLPAARPQPRPIAPAPPSSTSQGLRPAVKASSRPAFSAASPDVHAKATSAAPLVKGKESASADGSERKRKRGKRAKLIFLEELQMLGHAEPGQPVHRRCLCLSADTSPSSMIFCKRCSMGFHPHCVMKNFDGQDWLCPLCSVKKERPYPNAEIRVMLAGTTRENEFLDQRASLRSETAPVTRVQPWTFPPSHRILLHLETFSPAVETSEAVAAPVTKKPKTDIAAPVHSAPKSAARQTYAVPNSLSSIGIRATPGASTATSMHSTGVIAPVASRHPSGRPQPPLAPPSRRTEPSRPAPGPDTDEYKKMQDARHRAGMANLYSRGVTDAMIRRYHVGWNGKALVYPRCDEHGRFVEIDLGSHITLAPHDPEGTEVIERALTRQRMLRQDQQRVTVQREQQQIMDHLRHDSRPIESTPSSASKSPSKAPSAARNNSGGSGGGGGSSSNSSKLINLPPLGSRPLAPAPAAGLDARPVNIAPRVAPSHSPPASSSGSYPSARTWNTSANDSRPGLTVSSKSAASASVAAPSSSSDRRHPSASPSQAHRQPLASPSHAHSRPNGPPVRSSSAVAATAESARKTFNSYPSGGTSHSRPSTSSAPPASDATSPPTSVDPLVAKKESLRKFARMMQPKASAEVIEEMVVTFLANGDGDM